MNILDSWLDFKFYEFIYIDLIDGQRINLTKGESLLINISSIKIRNDQGLTVAYPASRVVVACWRVKEWIVKK